MAKSVQVFSGDGADYDPVKLDRILSLMDWHPVQVRFSFAVQFDPFKDTIGQFHGMAKREDIDRLIKWNDEGFFTDWDRLGELNVLTYDGLCWTIKHCWRESDLTGYGLMMIEGHLIELCEFNPLTVLADADELVDVADQISPGHATEILKQVLKKNGGFMRNFPTFEETHPWPMVQMMLNNQIDWMSAEDIVSTEPLGGLLPKIDLSIEVQEIKSKSRKLNI